MITIDIDRANELLHAAMLTKGSDFVYAPDGQSCHYTPDPIAAEGDPRRETGCLIGTALKIAGVNVNAIGGYGAVFSFAGTHESVGFRLTEDAARYFYIAQVTQDRGATWGQARMAAEAYRASLNWQADIW